jgi:hypothetical protein
MPRGARAALTALVAAGALLRLWQYFANASLWIDEIALAQNVLYWPLAHLIREPLALDQVAPPGFLALTKGVIWVLGPSERMLRLVPLLGGLLALILFPRLSRRFQSPWITVFASGLFAVLPTLIWYASDFKPYSTDVLVSILLTLAAFDLRAPRAARGRFAWAALLGAAAVWFSQPAVFVLAGLGAALLVLALTDRPRTISAGLVVTLIVWGAAAAAAAVAARHRVPPEMEAYLTRFWNPMLPRWPLLAFIALGAAALWIRDRRVATIVLGPVAVTLAAATARVYPFSGRAIAFLAPVGILAAAQIAGGIVDGLARLRVPRPVGALIPAAALAAVVLLDPPVYRDEDARPVLARVAKQWRPGDALYVLYAGTRAVRYYGPLVGLRSEGVTLGACHREDPRAYWRDLDAYRGQPRVWVFRTHSIGALAEEEILDGYLGRLGTRQERIAAEGADASLWDLSASTLPADAAETLPLPSFSASTTARVGCGHGPIGVAPWD